MTAEVRAKMNEADKSIRFDDVNTLSTVTKKKGVTLLFFGAKWCQYTAKFSPKWLKAQETVDGKKYANFHMAKVDCTVPAGGKDLCADKYGVYDFPTMLLWVDGVPSGEYEDDDETAPLLKWIDRKVSWYNKKHSPAPAVHKTISHKPAVHTTVAAEHKSTHTTAKHQAAKHETYSKKVTHTTTHSTTVAEETHSTKYAKPTAAAFNAVAPSTPTTDAQAAEVGSETVPSEAKKTGGITGAVVAVVVFAIAGVAVWKIRANRRKGQAIGDAPFGAGTNREQLL
ncbi:Protein disulfide-isomerase A3 [Rhizophlyctis rosea]|nr:Protein disulfide-isomerase A3 [Rhizophlyctis rosea]